MNAFRIAIKCVRIEPEKDQWDQEALDHYKQLIRAMRERGLTPVITLNHLTLPLWILTPPIEAHVQAYDIITSLDNIDADGDGVSKMVGFSHAMVAVSPSKPAGLFGATMKNNQDAARNFDYFVNDYFINAVVNGEEDLNYLDTLERHNKDSKKFVVHESWKNKVDFIGLNYYRRVYVHYSKILALSSAKFVGGSLINNLHAPTHNQPHGILNDLGWEIYPQGLYNLIIRIKNQ